MPDILRGEKLARFPQESVFYEIRGITGPRDPVQYFVPFHMNGSVRPILSPVHAIKTVPRSSLPAAAVSNYQHLRGGCRVTLRLGFVLRKVRPTTKEHTKSLLSLLSKNALYRRLYLSLCLCIYTCTWVCIFLQKSGC